MSGDWIEAIVTGVSVFVGVIVTVFAAGWRFVTGVKRSEQAVAAAHRRLDDFEKGRDEYRDKIDERLEEMEKEMKEHQRDSATAITDIKVRVAALPTREEQSEGMARIMLQQDRIFEALCASERRGKQ